MYLKLRDYSSFEKTLEDLCMYYEVTPVGFIESPAGKIYYAEGWQTRRPDFEAAGLTDYGPGWTVLGAVEKPPVSMAIYLKSTATPEQRRAAVEDWGAKVLGTFHRSDAV